jgi:hypothetical protein
MNNESALERVLRELNDPDWDISMTYSFQAN